MAQDNRTMGEKNRDAGPPKPQVETISLSEAIRRKQALERPQQRPAPEGAARIGRGVPLELLAAANSGTSGEVLLPGERYDTPASRAEVPIARPMSLVDAALEVARSLDRLSRNLEGAAEWCEIRAREFGGLEAGALLHAAKEMRAAAAKRVAAEPMPPQPEATSGEGTSKESL